MLSEGSTRERLPFSRVWRLAVGALLLGVGAVAGGAWRSGAGPRSLVRSGTALTGGTVGLARYQDSTKRCLSAVSLAIGAQLVLGDCDNSAPEQQFLQEGNVLRLRSRPEVCITQKGPAVDDGRMMALDTCQEGWDAQEIVGLCMVGYTPESGTLAFVGPCSQYKFASRAEERPVGLLGVSLFCWMAILPDSVEEQLRDAQRSRHAGIFACDGHKVYLGELVDHVHENDGDFAANTVLFMKIWMKAFDDGLYRSHDWTVKVDPDTVWMPDRLQGRLQALQVLTGEAVYVKNTNQVFGFLGPIEILSEPAVQRLAERISECNVLIDAKLLEEDVFLQSCLRMLEVPAKEDVYILDSSGQGGRCGDGTFVAFHPYKDPGSWGGCADAMMR